MKLLLPMLTIWGELIQAMEGCHGFGSDVAEIYAYRFLPYDPLIMGADFDRVNELWDLGTSFQDPLQRDAAIAACELFELFEEVYDCKIELKDGDSWHHHKFLLEEGFRHRVHLRVVENE